MYFRDIVITNIGMYSILLMLNVATDHFVSALFPLAGLGWLTAVLVAAYLFSEELKRWTRTASKQTITKH